MKKKTEVKKTVTTPTKKIKIARVIGVYTGKVNGRENYENVLFHLHDKTGTEVELPEKVIAKVEKSFKAFMEAQNILKKALEG